MYERPRGAATKQRSVVDVTGVNARYTPVCPSLSELSSLFSPLGKAFPPGGHRGHGGTTVHPSHTSIQGIPGIQGEIVGPDPHRMARRDNNTVILVRFDKPP